MRWIFDSAEGSAEMRHLLGGKGANFAEMTRVLGAGLVPPRVVRQLDVPDGVGREALPQVAAQVALGDVHVVQVPVDLQELRPDRLNDLDRWGRAVQAVPPCDRHGCSSAPGSA